MDLITLFIITLLLEIISECVIIMTRCKRRVYKLHERVLFDSFEHGEVIGYIDQVGSDDHLRISYKSPVNGNIEYETVDVDCVRIKNGWIYV